MRELLFEGSTDDAKGSCTFVVDGTLYLFICIAVLKVHGERALYRKAIHVLRVRWGYLASADRWVVVPKRGLAVADPGLVLGQLL